MPADTTAALVGQAKQGEARAFEALVRRHFRAAYAVALGVLARPADAEDVAQDSFLAAFERLADCREPERFAGWLLQIVRNRALNVLESKRVQTRGTDQLAVQPQEQGQLPEAGLRDRLLGALGLLKPAQREVVLLHDLDGWTHGEIAQALGISEVLSRQHLFQARRLMRAELGEPMDSEVSHG